jgi:large subunit ribosomal protein L11
MIIKLLIDGGDMKPGPAIAQQLGPLGINIGKVISSINDSTKEFKGVKVPVELNVNEKTKDFTVKTFSPPTSELIKKELKLEKGSNKHKEIKVGNASIEDIIKVTKIKYSNMLEKDFKSAVKSVLGTCASVGILVENKEPNELIHEVAEGKFDKEINSQKIDTTSEKRKNLEDYYKELKKTQDAKLEAAQKAAKEAEEAKAAAATAPAAGAAAIPEGAKPGAGSAGKPSKPEAKKEEKKK